MVSDNKCCECLSVRKLGLAFGFTFAIMMFVFGLIAMQFGIWTEMVELCSKVYIGFEPTFIGSIKGAFWGFIEGLIFGSLVAWVHNRV